MLEEFKKFAVRGNIVDFALGVVIGGAFGLPSVSRTTAPTSSIRPMPALRIAASTSDWVSLGAGFCSGRRGARRPRPGRSSWIRPKSKSCPLESIRPQHS